jgi:hypothetical protein
MERTVAFCAPRDRIQVGKMNYFLGGSLWENWGITGITLNILNLNILNIVPTYLNHNHIFWGGKLVMLPIHLPNVFSKRIWGVGSSRIWGVGSSPLFRFPEIVLFWSKWKTLDTDKRRSFIDVQRVKHGKNVVLS